MQFSVIYFIKNFPTFNPLSLYKILVILGQYLNKKVNLQLGRFVQFSRLMAFIEEINGFIMKKKVYSTFETKDKKTNQKFFFQEIYKFAKKIETLKKTRQMINLIQPWIV